MVQGGLQGAPGLSRLQFLLNLRGLFRKIDRRLFAGVPGLLQTDLYAVMALVPVLEGVGVDQHDGTLDEGLGAHQFVVGGIVGDVQHADLSGADLGTPGKVSGVQSKGAELFVAATRPYLVDARFADLGHGRRTSHLELALLAVLGTTATRFATLVASFACDTHGDLLFPYSICLHYYRSKVNFFLRKERSSGPNREVE